MNYVEIKVFMLRAGLTRKKVAEEIGIDRYQVDRWFIGRRAGRKIVKYLIQNGCPEQFFRSQG